MLVGICMCNLVKPPGHGKGGCVRVKGETGYDRNVRGGEQDGSPSNFGCSRKAVNK
jgi:hypothetical protein